MIITYKTISSIFIVPTLGIPRDSLYENNFINAYLGDIDKDEYHSEEVVFLLFKPKNIRKFTKFLNVQYQDNKSLIDDYDYDEGYVVLVYTLNETFKDDFTLIKQGRYSRVSEEFKNLFPKKVTLLGKKDTGLKDSLQWMIFRKDPKLVSYIEKIIDSDISNTNLEVWPTFDHKNEVLDIDKIIKNENKK